MIGQRFSLGVRKKLFTQRLVRSGTGYPDKLWMPLEELKARLDSTLRNLG